MCDFNNVFQLAQTSNAISTRTQYRLNMVATLFTSLNTNPEQTKLPTAPVHSQQPVLLVVQKTLPIFKAVGQLFVHDHKVIEAISTALKHAMTNLQNEFMPVMSIVCSMIVELMQLKCMPQLLDLTKTCVLLYYRDKKSMAMMQQLHVEVSAAILRLLDETPNAKLSDYSDVIEMFYSFNAQLTKKIPDAFRNPGVDNMKLLTHGKHGPWIDVTSVYNTNSECVCVSASFACSPHGRTGGYKALESVYRQLHITIASASGDGASCFAVWRWIRAGGHRVLRFVYAANAHRTVRRRFAGAEQKVFGTAYSLDENAGNTRLSEQADNACRKGCVHEDDCKVSDWCFDCSGV